MRREAFVARHLELKHSRSLLGRVWRGTFRPPVRRANRRFMQSVEDRIASGMRIADVGGGYGSFMGRVKDAAEARNARYLRIDTSVETAPSVVGDAQTLPLKPESMDLIILANILEHVPEPQAVVDRAHRALKPGGRIVFATPFLMYYHPTPEDHYRFTRDGLRFLFRHFREVTIESGGNYPYTLLSYLYMPTYWLDSKLRYTGMALRVCAYPLAKLWVLLDELDRTGIVNYSFHGEAVK
jgi:SAM-dependent methyltransferase